MSPGFGRSKTRERGPARHWTPLRTSTHQAPVFNLDRTGVDPFAAQLARRYTAGRRLDPLDCGCEDPWVHRQCRCTTPQLTEAALDGLAGAIGHLLALGITPVVELWELRALWHRGGAYRRLAQALHLATERVIG